MRGIMMVLFLSSGAYAQEPVLSAPLEPLRSMAVHAGITAGQVISVRVQEGQQVAVGDTLAMLNNPELVLNAQTVAIDHKKAQAQLHRARAMHERGLISAEQLDAVEFSAKIEDLTWQAVQMKLSFLAIRAPVAGRVTVLSVKPGDWIAARAEVGRIIDPGDFLTQLFVPEDQLRYVKVGMPVLAVPVGLTGAPLPGQVSHISPVIDPESGTCRVTAIYRNAPDYLRPGALVEVRFGATLATQTTKETSDGQ